MVATPTTSLGFQNFFSTTLSADITDTATDVFLTSVPNVSEGFLVIEPDSTTNREVIYYTSKTALKVVCPSVADGRGQDDTTAHSHTSGVTVIMAPVAAYFEAMQTLFQTTPAGWTSITGSISSVAYNGNREYSLTTSSDNSAVISKGMRLRTTRTVSAPTQCTSLNGSSQYYSKSSPAGMTFTDDFVATAWVKLNSYGAYSTIVSRYNGTSGWELRINTSGQVECIGYNGGASNFSIVTSYNSIPLGRWVHIAAQLDMSSFTATTTTSYVMLDGIDTPSSVARGGTNPTALVQAGNLEIGSRNGGGQFWPGKIAQVAVYSAKVTQANVVATISQGLSGSETSMISAYSFNNSINDLNANANNLTAQGSAVATNADSPFGNSGASATLDYCIVQTASASTLVVQVPEGCTVPTTGGVSAASYSSFKTPYGFPSAVDKWQISIINKVQSFKSSPSASTWYGGSQMSSGIGPSIYAPTGSWTSNYAAMVEIIKNATTTTSFWATLSTANNTESDANQSANVTIIGASGNQDNAGTLTRTGTILTTSGTPYFLNILTTISSASSVNLDGNVTPTVITLSNNYL